MKHPNIVAYQESFEGIVATASESTSTDMSCLFSDGGRLYIVMDYCDGGKARPAGVGGASQAQCLS